MSHRQRHDNSGQHKPPAHQVPQFVDCRHEEGDQPATSAEPASIVTRWQQARREAAALRGDVKALMQQLDDARMLNESLRREIERLREVIRHA